MAESFDHETLATLVQPILKTGADRLRFTPISTGKHNTSYWVDSDAGRYVLRLAPPDSTGLLFYERDMMRQEPALHALMRARTTMPVAEIIDYDFSRMLIDRDYLFMSMLPGIPQSDARSLTRRQIDRMMEQVGGYLRQLHDLTAAECLHRREYGYIGEHHPMLPQPTWIEAFRVMWNKLLDDIEASEAYSPDEAHAFRDLFERYAEYFDRPVVSSLLHMDIWSQNILVDETGTVTGIVDFDRALWGDVEIEFAVLDYTGFNTASFWAGYGKPRDESPAAQIRQVFYLLYEVQKYMPIAIWRGHDLAAALRYKRQCFALAEQLRWT